QYAFSLKTAEAAFIDAEKLFAEESFKTKKGWKKEGEHSAIAVWAKSTPQGKIISVSAVLDCPLEAAMNETWRGIDTLTSWNTQINYAEIIVTLSDHADILIYGNNDVLVVTGREFLTTRLYRKTGDGYIMASRSVELPEKPEGTERIRANVILGASRLRVDPTNARRTLCDVVMLGDLKGTMPKQIVDTVLPTVMVMATELNIKHFKEIGKSA
ncbi:hypothetical protein PFISCL1PPCAC_13673, partial [Pristionchus fissidentatus]